ncbi:MAG: hypothetical protein ABMA00_08075 [Gemmatimonas sp.]
MNAQTQRVASAVLAVLIATSGLQAQGGAPQALSPRDAALHEPRWALGGALGAVIGGTWLLGATSPAVTTGAGVALSLDVRRSMTSQASIGAVIRVTAQPLRLRETEAEWEGGTLTDAQLLATTAMTVLRGARMTSALEFGGGVALLSGAGSLYPFSAAARLTPAAEAGVSIQRGVRPGQVSNARPISVFVRYGLVRVDPGPTPAIAIDAMTASAGWVGRSSVGLRVER